MSIEYHTYKFFLFFFFTFVFFIVSLQLCEDIANIRKKIQRIGKKYILFLDETYKREGDVDNYSIVLPNESSFIHTSSTTSYRPRYDMIACISGKTTLPPIIYSSSEREGGVTQHMLLEHIRNLLAQAAGSLDTYPLILYLDRSPIHDESNMLNEFHDWGCQELQQVIKIPPSSAKRLSPLDNSLFNVWRKRVLDGGPLDNNNIKRRMIKAWESITENDIKSQYKHCGLMRNQDVYFDCPDPIKHRHNR
jgi:hypothetical protein